MLYDFVESKIISKENERLKLEFESQQRQKMKSTIKSAKSIIEHTSKYDRVHPIFLLIKGFINKELFKTINIALSSKDSAHTVAHVDEEDIFPKPKQEYYKGVPIEISRERRMLDEKLGEYHSKPSKISMDIYLGYDPILAYTWNTKRLINAYTSYGSHVFNPWISDRNHWAVLLQPFGITIIRGGNHSITTGILLNEGKIHIEDAYDMSSVFPHIYTDGVYYFRTKDNSIYAPVSNFSMAAVFEIGRLINEQKLSDVPIEFSSFYRDSCS